MSEENPNPGGPAGQPQSPEDALNAIKTSIANAFNLGLQSQPKNQGDTLSNIVQEIEQTIYAQLKQVYGKQLLMILWILKKYGQSIAMPSKCFP